jgi:general secretion pathway protein D
MRRAAGFIAAALCAGLSAACPARAAEAVSGGAPPASTVDERLSVPVSADLQDVDFGAAMQFLADSAEMNIIVSDNARAAGKPVTVHLVEMPLRRAIDYLLQGQGLLHRRDGEAIWVATREEMDAELMETRMFLLNRGPGLNASFEPFSATRESVALQSAGVREMTTIRDLVEDVIPQVGESSVMLDERTGSLIVMHAPYYLQQIEELLAQVDVTPAQIGIEARFVEITRTETEEWSVDGALTGNAALTKKTDKDGTQGPGLQLSSLGSSLLRGTEIDFSDFANQTSGNGLNLTLQGILSGTQYQAVLHALAQDERTKTLSSPRITALNNQTATIKIVTEFVYATRYQASVVREDLNSDGDFADTVSSVKETRFVNVPQDFVTKDLGILLHVTPSVGLDRRTITLALKPEVSELKTTDDFGGEVELPRFTARNLETSIAIDNGETVMLGGLMKDTTGRTVTRVPVLGSMPVLGKLFRKESDSVERSNLLIFVTAQLVDPSGAQLASGAP